jgi:hypothetical protein
VLRPEELVLLPLLPVVGEEVPAVDVEVEPVPCWVVAAAFAVEAVVASDTPAEPVATPAMMDAVMLDVLVGWGSLAGSSQVNMTPGTLSDMNK